MRLFLSFLLCFCSCNDPFKPPIVTQLSSRFSVEAHGNNLRLIHDKQTGADYMWYRDAMVKIEK